MAIKAYLVYVAPMDARGFQDAELMQHAHRSTLNELAEWTEWVDKVLVF
ncbi:hypothetical protein [Acinetobacter sp. GSS19]|nr:hypothetical protein [Acinetobacter sp. GSS19]